MKRALVIFGLISTIALFIIMAVANIGTASAAALSDKSSGKSDLAASTTDKGSPDACVYAWRSVSSANATATTDCTQLPRIQQPIYGQ